MQQRVILQDQRDELLDEITSALPKQWPSLPSELKDPSRIFGKGDEAPARLSFETLAGTLVYVDGEVLATGSLRDTLSMASGVHTVAFEHPELGRCEQEIELGAGESRSLAPSFAPSSAESETH
jgi:hypothetical protein